MYDNFDMPKCVILKENYDNNFETVETIKKTATVQFIAEMAYRETGETISFMETSMFQKATSNGPWLYLSGTIEEAPPPASQVSDDDDNDNDNKANPPLRKKQKRKRSKLSRHSRSGKSKSTRTQSSAVAASTSTSTPQPTTTTKRKPKDTITSPRNQISIQRGW